MSCWPNGKASDHDNIDIYYPHSSHIHTPFAASSHDFLGHRIWTTVRCTPPARKEIKIGITMESKMVLWESGLKKTVECTMWMEDETAIGQ